MNLNNQEKVTVNRQETEDMDKFLHLGKTVCKQGGRAEDVHNRIIKVRSAFQKQKEVWKSNAICKHTKIRLHKALEKPDLIYGCETWKMNKSYEKFGVFQHKCLRYVFKIRWQDRIWNEEMLWMAEINSVSDEIKRMTWRFTGHSARKDQDNNCRTALT